ncbi:MAG: transporter substrate-binding domain-containing protein, partial [Oscillospiraceae bacterium]
MKKRIFAILLLLLLCFSLLGSFPSFANNDVPIEIKVGVYDFAGFTEASALGKHMGYAVDYFNEIERGTNLKFVYVEATDWNACYDMLQKGEIDIVAGTVKTPEREEATLFSTFPMANSSLCLCVSQNSTYSYADYENFDGMIIATAKNDTRTARLRRHASEKGFTFKMAFYPNENKALSAVYNGEADAFLSDKMRVSSSERSIDDFGLMPLYFMINKDKPWLKDEIDNAMEDILIKRSSFNDDLYAKHFQSQMYNMPSFTQQEKKMIEDTGIVTLYYNPYLAPLSYNSQNNAAGICIDIADVLSKRIGIQLNPVSMPNTSVENAPSVKTEDIKKILISCVFNNKSLLHEYSLQATDTYLDVPVVLVGKDSTAKRQSGKTVAVNAQDRNLQYYLAETYPYLSPVFVDNMNDCFAKMLSGE